MSAPECKSPKILNICLLYLGGDADRKSEGIKLEHIGQLFATNSATENIKKTTIGHADIHKTPTSGDAQSKNDHHGVLKFHDEALGADYKLDIIF